VLILKLLIVCGWPVSHSAQWSRRVQCGRLHGFSSNYLPLIPPVQHATHLLILTSAQLQFVICINMIIVTRNYDQTRVVNNIITTISLQGISSITVTNEQHVASFRLCFLPVTMKWCGITFNKLQLHIWTELQQYYVISYFTSKA
jgi:hypothetical protein